MFIFKYNFRMQKLIITKSTKEESLDILHCLDSDRSMKVRDYQR